MRTRNHVKWHVFLLLAWNMINVCWMKDTFKAARCFTWYNTITQRPRLLHWDWLYKICTSFILCWGACVFVCVSVRVYVCVLYHAVHALKFDLQLLFLSAQVAQLALSLLESIGVPAHLCWDVFKLSKNVSEDCSWRKRTRFSQYYHTVHLASVVHVESM